MKLKDSVALSWFWVCSLHTVALSLTFTYPTKIPTPDAFHDRLRLVHLSTRIPIPISGRLEIYLNGAWGTVCADGFDFYEGDIACRQLGFLYADRVGTVGELGFREGNSSVLLKDVNCDVTSSNIHLEDCQRSLTPKCAHSRDVALRCSSLPSPLRLVAQTGQTSETASLSAGRLEIFINGQWGTVCDDLFDIHDANVACHQMGFAEAVAYGSMNLGYPVSLEQPIWLDDLMCTPSLYLNNNLRLCRHVGIGWHNCHHSEDVVLSCLAEGNLRLNAHSLSTKLVSSGRLEIYLNDEWGTVCGGDSFSEREAGVACRQMGFFEATSYGNDLGLSQTTSASSPEKIWLANVNCTHHHTPYSTLLSCHHSSGVGVANCNHTQDVQLTCGSEKKEEDDAQDMSSPDNARLVTAIAAPGVIVAVLLSLVLCITGCSKYQNRNSGETQGPASASQSDLSRAPTAVTVDGAPGRSDFNLRPIQHTPPTQQSSQQQRQQPKCNSEHSYSNSDAADCCSLQEAPPPSYETAIAYLPPSSLLPPV